jgi:hypothetical protein
MKAERRRLNKSVQHLSYKRADYEVDGKDWDLGAVYRELKAVWLYFIGRLSADRRAWFTPPQAAQPPAQQPPPPVGQAATFQNLQARTDSTHVTEVRTGFW